MSGASVFAPTRYAHRMTDAAKRASDLATGLMVFGGLAAAGGVVGAFVAKGAAEKQAITDEFSYALNGAGLIGVTPDYTGMWIAIVVGVLGVITLLAGVIVLALRPRTVEPAVLP